MRLGSRAKCQRWRRSQGGLALCIVLMCGLAGCGNAGTTVGDSGEAHALELADGICREYNSEVEAESTESTSSGSGPGGPLAAIEQSLRRSEVEAARLRGVLAGSNQIPAVAKYRSDLAANGNVLMVQSRRLERGHATYEPAYATESQRIYRKLASDAKALGLVACLGPRPRHPIRG